MKSNEKIMFFVKLLGFDKVEEILEEYVIKNFKTKDGIEVAKTGRPIGSENKKKHFPNGMRRYKPEEDTEIVKAVTELVDQGIKKGEAYKAVGKKYGVTGAAISSRLFILNKNGRSIQSNRETVSS